MRRTIAGVGLALVAILLILGVRGCLNARSEQAIEDYGNDSAELLRASKLQGDQLFELLQSQGGTDETVNINNALNGYVVEAGNFVDRAKDLDVPDEMSSAQDALVEVLELRSDGFRRTADAMRVALGDQDRREGTQDVTEAMQVFLASDTIDTIRFRPPWREVLAEEELREPELPRAGFVPDVEWLDEAFVADQIEALRTGTGAPDGDAAPGLHGNGIASVSLGGVALTPGAAGTTVQLSEDLAFDIQVQNQGENTETDVTVTVSVGEGNDAIERDEVIDTIAAGEIKPVTIPLAEQPPAGQSVPITVEVQAVAGEEKTDNNIQEFSVIFTR